GFVFCMLSGKGCRSAKRRFSGDCEHEGTDFAGSALGVAIDESGLSFGGGIANVGGMRIYPVLFWAVVVLAGCVAKPEETAAVVAPVSEKREIEKVAPEVAAKRVAEGTAVLVDVREPSEWHESGVAAP